MKKSTTKRALFLSVLSLFLCFTMLLGTTYAWFTDSASAKNNIIKAGNLDVELEYSTDMTDGSWKTLDDQTNVFESKLWEPGHTEVVYLRISNLGTLALKYQLGINVVSEISGTNMAGNSFKLSDYIEFDVVENVTAKFNDRATALSAATSLEKISAGYTKNSSIEAGQPAHVVALVVTMPEKVGNEANYKTAADGEPDEKYMPSVNLGINVLATQLAAELDSFDNTYDEGAFYADYYVRSNEELADAITNAKAGEIIALYAGDYSLPKNDDWYTATRLPDNLTIVGAEAGVKLTPVIKGADVGEQGRIFANGYRFENLTFTNTISPSGYGEFVDCVFAGYNGLRQGAYKGETKFVNCVFNNADGWAFHTEYLYGADVHFQNCRFNGLVEFTDTIEEVNKVYFDNCVFAKTNRLSSGKVFYAWKNNAVLTNCAGYNAATFEGTTATGTAAYVSATDAQADPQLLKNALAIENATVLLDAGNYGVCPKLAAGASIIGVEGTVFENTAGDAIPKGFKDGTLFENITFRGQNTVSWGSASLTTNVTFKNCTIDAGFHIDSSAAGGKVIFDGCTFTGLAYIKFGGSAEYVLNNCIVEEISPELTAPWGREYLITYGNITLTDCETARLVRAGATINITIDSCTKNGTAIVDDSIVYKYQGVNYNNPTVTIK